ncbi:MULTISPECIES: cytochrome c oxidase assembly protein [Streptacidiphilus]|uniref:Cytochrome c oxidase assembly protein n=1 Tax=Streptacidiphilus cavernicola TaxID=3342716 RepID=A0ABV6UP62_9ACTN|nr:cytochrome c oxidase assembly protein [Streptacidiphilus jeojiense]
MSSYAGPPAFTLHRALTGWHIAPAVLVLATAGAAAYLIALIRLHRHGTPWAPSRTAAFALGTAVWVFTCCGGPGVYERVLFTDRAVQCVVLLMVVPLLLALGAPVTLAAQTLPTRAAQRLRAALAGRCSRALMFPLVSTVLLIMPPWLLYYTSWYQNSLTHPGWNALFHTGFVAFGLAYYWPRLQIDPVAHHYHPLIGIVITIAEVIFDAALGFTLVYGHHQFATTYWQHLHRPWGMDPHTDQQWGGAVLWGLGDIAGIPFLVALIARFIKDEHQRTRDTDTALDRLDTQHPTPANPGTESGPRPENGERPWWLTDPQLAHRYRDPSP